VSRGLRFFELFRRTRRYEERLAALQSSFDHPESQSGGTQQGSPGQQHPDDARAELLIGLNDDLDKERRGRTPRWAVAYLAFSVAGAYALLSANGQGEVLGALILALAFLVGWGELKRLKRVRVLQRLIERELSSPIGKESPRPPLGLGETSSEG